MSALGRYVEVQTLYKAARRASSKLVEQAAGSGVSKWAKRTETVLYVQPRNEVRSKSVGERRKDKNEVNFFSIGESMKPANI